MADELLGPIDAAVLRAIGAGRTRPHRIAESVRIDAANADSLVVVHRVLERCQRHGLLRGERDSFGRVFALTATGRRSLRNRREFGESVARLLAGA